MDLLNQMNLDFTMKFSNLIINQEFFLLFKKCLYMKINGCYLSFIDIQGVSELNVQI